MRRTEKLNISIRPDLKEGVKKIFEGQKMSDAYETLVMSYLNHNIEWYSKCLAEEKEQQKLYIKGNVKPKKEVLMSFKENLLSYELNRTKFQSLMLMCFPNQVIQGDLYDIELDSFSSHLGEGMTGDVPKL